eukprot:7382002-Prymnesium_polylepis.3
MKVTQPRQRLEQNAQKGRTVICDTLFQGGVAQEDSLAVHLVSVAEKACPAWRPRTRPRKVAGGCRRQRAVAEMWAVQGGSLQSAGRLALCLRQTSSSSQLPGRPRAARPRSRFARPWPSK